MDEDKNKNTLGYKIGQAFACVVAACLIALCVALTVSIINWMLF